MIQGDKKAQVVGALRHRVFLAGALPALAIALCLCRGAAAQEEAVSLSAEPLELMTEDGVKLEARLEKPTEWTAERGLAVVCHPHPLYGGNMHNAVSQSARRALNEAGIATIRLNFRGTGRSGGEHSAGVKEPLDVLAAVAYARDELKVESRRLALVGYSFGAAVTASALARLPAEVAYAGIALPLHLKPDGDGWDGLMQPERRVLLVAGGADEIAPLARIAELAAERLGTTRVEVIGRASHFFDAGDQLSAVGTAVAEFLMQL